MRFIGRLIVCLARQFINSTEIEEQTMESIQVGKVRPVMQSSISSAEKKCTLP